MADEITITHGSVTVVDSGALRDAISRVQVESMRIGGALDSIENAYHGIYREGLDAVGVHHVRRMTESLRSHLWSLASNGEYTADLYEVAELKATMAGMPEGPELHALQERLNALFSQRPGLEETYTTWLDDAQVPPYDRRGARLPLALLGGLGITIGLWGGRGLDPKLQAWLRAKGFGAVHSGWIHKGDRLKEKASSVVVERSTDEKEVSVPQNLEEIVDRLKELGDNQISIDVITLENGEQHAMVYIGGTLQPDPFGEGSEPFSMESNLETYLMKTESDSYHAVLRALEAAGIEKGSSISLFGHSQGAMNAAALEASGDYNVKLNVGVGTPMRVAGTDSQQVVLLNSSDLVGNLTYPRATGEGNADSFDVWRDTSEVDFSKDKSDPDMPQMEAHYLDAYYDTATMADNSGDARVENLHDTLTELAEGTPVERHDFKAVIPE